MTRRTVSSVVVLSLLTIACATTSAPSKATEVARVSQPPTDCRALGPVSGYYQRTGAWAATGGQVSTGAAEQDLLENAAKQGATHVVIEANSATVQFANSASATGMAYQCPKVATTK